eukprot:GEMP01007655.1.p1 GENE.GEMP01007655.1~~GEMP01007655.1.p1  ORF type:complete len:823 (+),score=214.09 GEMP01007655.1:297-2765(+)
MYGMRILWWVVVERGVFLVSADKLDTAKTNMAVSSHGASVHGNWATRHKATYAVQCTKDSKQELGENQIRKRIDQYFNKFGFAASEEDKGKYSLWDVAGIIPFCRIAICSREVGHAKPQEPPKKARSQEHAKRSSNELVVDSPLPAKVKADKHDEHDNDEHDNDEHDNDEHDNGNRVVGGQTPAPEDDEPNIEDDEHAEKERAEFEGGDEGGDAALLQTKEHGSEKRRTGGAAMADFEPELAQETLSLCVAHYYTMRCGKQKGGAVMSIQCFLAEDNAIDNKAIDEDILKQLEMLEESTRKHMHERSQLCNPLAAKEKASSDALKETTARSVDESVIETSNVEAPEDESLSSTLPCDFSLEYEKLMLKSLSALDRDVGILICERSVFEAAKRKKRVWGSPIHIPEWQVPKIHCGVRRQASEYSMVVRLLARKHRLSYMQSWYARMENELFHGEWQWFISHMRNFTNAASKPKPAKSSRMTELVERIQEVTGKSRHKGEIAGAKDKDAALNDQMDLLRSLDNEEFRPKTGSGIYSPTHRQYALTSWNYRISAVDSDSLRANHRVAALSSYYDYTQELGKQNLADLGAPDIIGRTRWLDFLQSSNVWVAGFWRLVSPANYQRLLAQMEITKDLCKNLGISTTEYRPHTRIDHHYAMRDQAAAGSDEESSHFPTEFAEEQIHAEQEQKDIAKHEHKALDSTDAGEGETADGSASAEAPGVPRDTPQGTELDDELSDETIHGDARDAPKKKTAEKHAKEHKEAAEAQAANAFKKTITTGPQRFEESEAGRNIQAGESAAKEDAHEKEKGGAWRTSLSFIIAALVLA